MTRSVLLTGCLLVIVSAASPLWAQNLLTNNAGFEVGSGYYTPGWGFPQGSPEVLPGWIITLDPAGDGYAGAAANQSPLDLEGAYFGYIYSGSGSSGVLATAPDSRAPVEKDQVYTLWFLARADVSWSEASMTVSLMWYPNQNNNVTVGQTNLNLTLPARLTTDDPMLAFQLTAVAPAGAHFAGVQITRPPYDYAAIIFDDFVLMAEPTDVSLAINSKESNARVSWARSRKFRLETSTTPILSNSWNTVDHPVKGVGDKNHVDYPLTETCRFFRLAPAD
ncbi:MAG: hypothetical protein QM813_24510 [Verrucomicrobiota bacterium]